MRFGPSATGVREQSERRLDNWRETTIASFPTDWQGDWQEGVFLG
jgi:hypothetical protein